MLNRSCVKMTCYIFYGLLMVMGTVVGVDEIAINVDNTKMKEFRNMESINTHSIPDLTYLVGSTNKKHESLQGFLQAWSIFSSGQRPLSKDEPFTLIVPKIDFKTVEKERLSEFLLEHLIPGKAFDTFNEEDIYGNANKHPIIFKSVKNMNESQWTINGLKILRTTQVNDKLSAIYLDGFLGDRKGAFSKRNIQEHNRYNEPQRLEMKDEMHHKKEIKHNHLMTFLSGMKTGTKVFQHFLSKSNISQELADGSFNILIPSDNAFQRWHPIDWGFYPFSVQEFTENILRNHFIQNKKPIRMDDLKTMSREQSYQTLGGENVVFRNNPSPSVNNVTIMGAYTLPNDNEVFIISEVLFVSEAVVSRLHQMHKDKETPPLLAFPWFGAQFLSHSFLALERDSRFSQITRFLNSADIAQYISGANYTFFVPNDEAFKKHGLENISEMVMASEAGVKLLLQHFVKGRLYDRDLRHDEVFETIGGNPIKVRRTSPADVSINNAHIEQSEVFVYNLGTMFYVDDILYVDILKEAVATESSMMSNTEPTTKDYTHVTVKPDVEVIPRTIEYDSLDHTDEDSDEIITPRALPLRFDENSPK